MIEREGGREMKTCGREVEDRRKIYGMAWADGANSRNRGTQWNVKLRICWDEWNFIDSLAENGPTEDKERKLRKDVVNMPRVKIGKFDGLIIMKQHMNLERR